MTSRKLESVTRALSNGKEKLPEGLYVNVNFATKFSNEAKPVRELVSFHLDSDMKWRLSGAPSAEHCWRRPAQAMPSPVISSVLLHDLAIPGNTPIHDALPIRNGRSASPP